MTLNATQFIVVPTYNIYVKLTSFFITTTLKVTSLDSYIKKYSFALRLVSRTLILFDLDMVKACVHWVVSDGRQRAALGGCERGVPHVHDEHEARARAVVPHFVLEAVVEHKRFAHLPLSANEKYIILNM